ncbi:hypothetical protein QJS10_CPA02g00962 [Acorus calamus]|uniref:Trichome birefringence-like N-terminal domain-containing protein n=1 Tax=Acorus calamus TaxID=4465 RepID=A0AAV9FDN1_ACOCL|nr:hypothetical protein QJS10_CPA02g00962 [Acorus calamus]
MEEMDDEVDVIQSRPGQGSYMKGLRCDLSDGEWVHDWSYPLYRVGCPYISSGLSCWRNGRPDSDYEKWRWSPHGCSMPRWVEHILSYACNGMHIQCFRFSREAEKEEVNDGWRLHSQESVGVIGLLGGRSHPK